MDPSLPSAGPAAVLIALALVVAMLAAYVALELTWRTHLVEPTQARSWRLGAGLAWGTGLWAVHVLVVSSATTRLPLAYHPLGLVAAWLSAVALGLVTVVLVERLVAGWWRLGGAALVVSLGLLGVQVLGLLSLGLQPGPRWHAGPLGLAVLAALLGAALFLWCWVSGREWLPTPARRHAVAAALMGLVMVGSQQLLLHSVDLPAQTHTEFEGGVALGSLTSLASIGTLAVLVMMLVVSLVAESMRASLSRARGELQKQANRDALTELPNRLMFEQLLDAAAHSSDEHRERLAVLFIDLDGFKPINESFGLQGGDKLLRSVAARLLSLTGEHAAVARLGSDEFLLLLQNDPAADQAARVAAQVLDLLSQPYQLDGKEASLTCSIGIAMYPEHGASSRLIAHADAAMNAAKGNGGGAYCFYDASMASSAREQVELLNDLRRALSNGELELYYQPKVHAPSGEITGAEALMRWHHPRRGLISPGVFIPIAERFGLIGSLGNWVIDEACRQARAWRDEGLRMRVAINLSVHQLRETDLAERISDALIRHQINPKLLTCEITESVAMEDGANTMKVFEKLALVGVHISIDDFGTGYSSLAYLRKLPAEELKIDRSFVSDLASSADARAVVDAVVKLAHALGLKVVAEGVETERQYEILRDLGCHELQGFLFAKPMSAKALSQWAMEDIGPRDIEFRASLFGETRLHELQ